MKNSILKFVIPTVIISLFIAGTVYAVTAFNSAQVGSSPSNGKVLQTNGSTSTWVATSTLGIVSGGTPASPVGGLQYNNSGSFGGVATGTPGYVLSASSTAASGYSWVANTASTGATTTILTNVTTNGPNFTFASGTPDTNIGLALTGSGTTITFQPVWSGTLAAGRLNSNVVQSFTNDTNVTATISAQNATLGWTGVLAPSRGGTGTSTAPTQQGQLLGADSTGVKYAPVTLINTATLSVSTGTVQQLSFNVLQVPNAVTFNNSGSGASSGQTYNGSSAQTISYNTIGAQVAGTYVTGITCSGSILPCTGTTPTVQLQNLTTNDILFGQGTNVIATSSLFTFSTASGLTVNATSTLATTTITKLILPNSATTTSNVLVVDSSGNVSATSTQSFSLANLVLGTGLTFTSGDGLGIVIGTSTTIGLSGVVTNAYASSTFPSFSYASSSYQLPITLTTTGSSGAATFLGNILNIPQYSGGGGGAGGGWATSTPQYITTTYPNTTGTKVGINSSTPIANLVVAGITGSTTPIFVVASSTGTSYLSVAATGSTTVTGLILGNVQSGTQCLHALSTGQVVGTGSDCGSGGGGGSGVPSTTPFTAGFIQEATGTNVSLSNSSLWQAVNGSMAINTTTASTTLVIAGMSGIDPFWVASSTGSYTPLFTIKQNGDVGVGIAKPTMAEDFLGVVPNSLETAGDIYALGNLEMNGNFINNNNDKIITNGVIQFNIGQGNDFTKIGFYGNSGVESMAEDAGKYGIATTTPAAQLDVYGTGTLDPFNVSSSSNSSLFTVKASGNVGIGTSTPFFPLDIRGSTIRQFATGTDTTLIQNRTDGSAVLLGSGVAGSGFNFDGNGFKFAIGSSTRANIAAGTYSGADLLTILSTGKVGVGSSTPNYGFVANGTVAMPNLTQSSGLQTGVLCSGAGGQIINDSVACLASAARYKQNINPLIPGLNEVMKLTPVSYYFKPDFNGSLQKNPNYSGLQYGLIADDVQKIDPNLVIVTTATTTFEGKKYPAGTVQGLQSSNTWAGLFVKAFQDIENQITSIFFKLNTQDSKIQTLQSKVDKQQTQIDHLEGEINILMKR